MTEVAVGNAEQHNESSAGTLLRQAREEKQMSVQTLASALKVPVYKLQALEEDRWEQLTDSVFTRSLALSVCRVLRIPSEPILARLPKLEGAKLSTNPEGINAPFKEKSLRSLMSPSQEPASGKAVKVVLALLIALAGGAGLYFLPQWQASHEEDASAQVAEATTQEPLFMPQPADIAPAAPAAATEPAMPAPEASLAPAAGMIEPALKEGTEAVSTPAAQAPTAPAAAGPATTTPAATTPAVVAAAAEPTTAPEVPAGAAMLRFTATGESWVQVRNAQQRVVMEKILKAGDVYEEVAAGRPLQVVVGNAGVTKLEIDGAAFDLAASAKNNVARFEVK